MSFDDYIFVSPGFRRGLARVFDVGASLSRSSYLYSATPAEADRTALESDWALIARDFAVASARVAGEQEEQAEPTAA